MHYQVIIVGAGVSGLTIANELIQNGIKDILVLEAQDRIGGRIHTIDAGDGKNKIELGAQWIHGQKNNPVYELCNKLNLVDKSTKTEISDQVYCYTQDGRRLDDDDELDSLFDKVEDIFESIEDYDSDTDASLNDFLEPKFKNFLKKLKSKANSQNKIEIAKAIYEDLCKEEMASTACENLNEMSIIGWNEYDEFQGDYLTNLKNGYEEFIKHLSSKIPENQILNNEIVTKIKFIEPSNIIIETHNPITKMQSTFYTDYCACTISLGCLKTQHADLFEPSLPSSKINAIEKLGFGVVDKVFVIFDEPVFKNRDQGLNIYWRDDIDFNLDSIEKWDLKNTTFIKSFTSFEVLPKMSNVLYSFIVGEDAKYIEELEPECLLEVISELLMKCVSDIKLPQPKCVVRSQWFKNEFTRGSYSYIKIGSSSDDINDLAQSWDSRIYFAGEATHPVYYSSVHGAYASGLKCAKDIIEILDEK